MFSLLAVALLTAGPAETSDARFSVTPPPGWTKGSVEGVLIKTGLESEGLKFLATFATDKGSLSSGAVVAYSFGNAFKVTDVEAQTYLRQDAKRTEKEFAEALTGPELKVQTITFDKSRLSYWAVFQPNANRLCAMGQFITTDGLLYLHAYSDACSKYMPSFTAMYSKTLVNEQLVHPALRHGSVSQRAPAETAGSPTMPLVAGSDEAVESRKLEVRAQIERKLREGMSEHAAARWVLGAMVGVYLLETDTGAAISVRSRAIEGIAAAESAYTSVCLRCASKVECDADRLSLLVGWKRDPPRWKCQEK